MTAIMVPSDISEDDLYDIADAIELAMETKPMGHGWTPSVLGRKMPATTSSVTQKSGAVLSNCQRSRARPRQ